MDQFKRCTKCRLDMPVSEFGRDARRKSGLQSWCRPCANTTRRVRYMQDAEYRGDKREQAWATRLRRLYGISAERYWEMWTEQGGRCAICLNRCPSGNRLAVDHCHGTGRVRGLLCICCNTNVGIIEGWASEYEEVLHGYLR